MCNSVFWLFQYTFWETHADEKFRRSQWRLRFKVFRYQGVKKSIANVHFLSRVSSNNFIFLESTGKYGRTPEHYTEWRDNSLTRVSRDGLGNVYCITSIGVTARSAFHSRISLLLLFFFLSFFFISLPSLSPFHLFRRVTSASVSLHSIVKYLSIGSRSRKVDQRTMD